MSDRPITGLPDLGHDWKPVRVDDGPFWYECRCLAPRSPVPHRDSFCPDAVLDYANRLVAEERARAVAVLEGVRGAVLARAAEASAADDPQMCDYNDGLAAGADFSASVVTEALTTLTGSDR